MTVAKKKDTATSQATSQPLQTATGSRKPWKKKTPVQILLDQVAKLREEIKQDEEELEQKREQLQKFEEASKLFEKK